MVADVEETGERVEHEIIVEHAFSLEVEQHYGNQEYRTEKCDNGGPGETLDYQVRKRLLLLNNTQSGRDSWLGKAVTHIKIG